MTLPEILSDGFFAAVAAIGFGAISDPPMRAFPSIALLAAIGHALRFCLMQSGTDIVTASLCASVAIGVGSLLLGGRIRCPMTVLFIPALLPMVPGMYAYKTVFSMIMFMQHLDDPTVGSAYLTAIVRTGFITCSVIFMLAAGAAAPIFIFNKRAHSLTRDRRFEKRASARTGSAAGDPERPSLKDK